MVIVFAAVLPLPFLALIFGNESVVILGTAMFVASLSGLAAAFVISRHMIRRVRRLEEAAREIGDGDLSVHVPVAESGQNEIARLERAFNGAVTRIAQRRDRFVELDTLKSDFVSSVSHELRTPLTTIKALARLLMRDDLTSAKRTEYLQTIAVECDRQIDLVLNLLDLSRIEGGVFRLALERVDVTEVVQSCVASERRAAERRGHRIHVDLSGAVPAACADPKALRRVLRNLIENAIKYTPDGGTVSIRVAAEGDRVRISVKDNGRGIPAEDLPVLFDKFHRGRPAQHSDAMRAAAENSEFLEDADVSGLGLGLYLGKNIMERMNGAISVETEVGRGSEFTLHLPSWQARLSGNVTQREEANGKAAVGC